MNTQQKNYVAFANDHSQSMRNLAAAALKDYNTNVTAVKNAATNNMLDTIVSVVSFGTSIGKVERTIANSNPHVLNPLTHWPTNGNTPLYDAIGNIINLFQSMPDFYNPNVSFLAFITTDGLEYGSINYNKTSIARKIAEVSEDGRWTFVFRIPKGSRKELEGLNIPYGNIQEWETTSEGMLASTQVTTQAIDKFYATRSAGSKSSSVFYADASNITPLKVKTALENISDQVSYWLVLDSESGDEIKTFAEKRLGTAPFLKGAAFYQLTKTEARVQGNKLIVIRDKTNGQVYFGPAAREMIGLPQAGTVRLHPDNHANYDIFIQSTSINRKLVAGTTVLYWPKVGTGFTAEDFPWLKTGQANVTPALQKAAEQAISTTSPANSPQYFQTRELARMAAKNIGKPQNVARKLASGKWCI